jgi:ABC-type phosphate transport system ATPase subunit
MFNLIPYLNVLENIVLPCGVNRERGRRLNGLPLEKAAKEMAKRLGIGSIVFEQVTDLSVGQQQRVATARALLGSPELLSRTSDLILDEDQDRTFSIYFTQCREIGSTSSSSIDRRMMPLTAPFHCRRSTRLLVLRLPVTEERKLTSILTVLSLALSVCLWVGIEHIRVGARRVFPT